MARKQLGVAPAVSTDAVRKADLAPRVVSVTFNATPTFNIDNGDMFVFASVTGTISNMSTNMTGTPYDGQRLTWRFKDNGTARAITTWGTNFISSGVASLLASTVISKTHLVTTIYDSVTGKHVCVACDPVGY